MKKYRHRPVEELALEALNERVAEDKAKARKHLRRGRFGRWIDLLKGKPPIKEFVIDPHTLGLRSRSRWE